MTSKHEAAINAQQLELDHHAEELQQLASDHADALDLHQQAHEEALAAHAAELERRNAALEELSTSHHEQLSTLEAAHNAQVEATADAHTTKVEEDRAALDALRSQRIRDLASSWGEHEQTLAALVDKHNDTLSESLTTAQAAHADVLANQSNAHLQALELLKEEHAKTLMDAESRHTMELAKCRSELDSKCDELRKLVTAHQEVVQDFEIRTKSMKESHNAEIDILIAQSKQALASQDHDPPGRGGVWHSPNRRAGPAPLSPPTHMIWSSLGQPKIKRGEVAPGTQKLTTHTTPNETNKSAEPPQDHRGGAGEP